MTRLVVFCCVFDVLLKNMLEGTCTVLVFVFFFFKFCVEKGYVG